MRNVAEGGRKVRNSGNSPMVEVLPFLTFPSFLLVLVSFVRSEHSGLPYLSGLIRQNGGYS